MINGNAVSLYPLFHSLLGKVRVKNIFIKVNDQMLTAEVMNDCIDVDNLILDTFSHADFYILHFGGSQNIFFIDDGTDIL